MSDSRSYAGKLRIGAVYQSHDPRIARRIERIAFGCVYYVYHQQGKWPKSGLGMPEELFRNFTAREIRPVEAVQ